MIRFLIHDVYTIFEQLFTYLSLLFIGLVYICSTLFVFHQLNYCSDAFQSIYTIIPFMPHDYTVESEFPENMDPAEITVKCMNRY